MPPGSSGLRPPGALRYVSGLAPLRRPRLAPGNDQCPCPVVEAGATATLQDSAKIGAPILANIGNQVAGGALVRGTLILEDDALINGNIADTTGGVQLYGGTLELRDRARIVGNTGRAGGILAYDGAQISTAEGATPAVTDNNGNSYGGGFTVLDATAELDGVEVADNASEGCGAGMLIDHADAVVELENGRIERNHAGTCGGGVALIEGEINFAGVEFRDNTSGTDGGGLYLEGTGSTAVLSASLLGSGSASSRGGGIAQLSGATLTLTDVDVHENLAATDGGGIFVGGSASQLYMSGAGGSINRNSAERGGGLFAEAGDVSLTDQSLNDNTAVAEGGGVRVTAGADVGFYFGAARRNVAGTHGGAFAVPGGTLEIVGSDVFANEASDHGGAGAVTLTGIVNAKGVWFRRNQAGGRGGAWAVLAFDEASNPRLTIDGDRDLEGCTGRGNVGFNEYLLRASEQLRGRRWRRNLHGGRHDRHPENCFPPEQCG